MKVIKKAVKKTYIFNCPNCGARLEAEPSDFEDMGNKIKAFYCPVCCKKRHISWRELRKKTIYENISE